MGSRTLSGVAPWQDDNSDRPCRQSVEFASSLHQSSVERAGKIVPSDRISVARYAFQNYS